MKVDIHINGQIRLDLTPENDIEALVLSSMAKAAEKSTAVSVGHCATEGVYVEVPR